MKFKWPFIVILNAIFVFLFLYLAHFYYQSQILKRPELITLTAETQLTEDDVLRLGFFDKDRKRTSFIPVTNKKKAGVIRIGFFGDSHTFGNEVASDKNFPSLFQNMVGENIEVINFGNGWYSFAQSFILWQIFASEFELDIVIYGPRGFHPERNLTFNHTQDNYPSYLHSRFVIDSKQELSELRPEGITNAERISRYYSFFPPMLYWKFDRRAPSFLRAYEYFFNKTLKNPFYYTNSSSEEENRALIELFLKTMATRSPRLLVLSDDHFSNQTELSQILEKFDNSSLILIVDHLKAGVPFRARMGHSSVFGNQLIANQLYQYIQEELSLPKREFTDRPRTEFFIPDDLNLRNADDFTKLFLYLNHKKIGYLGGAYRQSTLDEQKQYDLPVDFSKNQALIALECPEKHLANSLILGLKSADFSLDLNIQNIGNSKIFLKLPLSNCYFDEGLNSLMVKQSEFALQPFRLLRDGVYLDGHKLFALPITTYKNGVPYYQLAPIVQAYKFAVYTDADERLFQSGRNDINHLTLKLEFAE